jgi:epoxyqueuosine reductase
MEISSAHIKEIAAELGADLCGIASIDRFEGAPQGFHPRDVLPECQSVIVLASCFLKSTLYARSTIPYTVVRNELSVMMDWLSIKLANFLDSEGVIAVPTGAIGPCNWDAETKKSRGIISLKHAAVRAGLGKIGKNTLLINDKYGNMLWLSAVLASLELEADPIATYEGCIPSCKLCLTSCPVEALDGISIDQQSCWNYAFGEENGGEWRIKCYTCRKVCPNCLSIQNPS